MSDAVAHTVLEVAETVAETAVPAQKAVNNMTRLFWKGVGKAKRFSPEILMVAGVAGVVTAGVLACKATLKLEDVVDKAEDEIDAVKVSHKNGEYETETAYTKALSKVYINRSLHVLKLYTPALSVGVVGVSCLLGAHGIMHKRNVATVAAYKAVEASFSEYRNRVVSELGEEKDKQFRYGLVETEIPEFDEDGKQIGTKKQVEVDMAPHSSYARIFDESNENWSKIPGVNQMFLTVQQNWLNERLNARGFLFLNDVYKSLGFPETSGGQIVGWLRHDHEDSKDGFVDLGLWEINDKAKREFVNGFERSAILDFNVDGIIYDKI